ncbi:MAG: pilus assembly protein [Burkholderiales bacterium]|nr:pilus assembly protein [Phycisphaerae bacterium]
MKQNKLNRRRGSAVLDAALVFPILLSLTFGCVEYGHYFFVKHSLQGAAREGARAGANPGSTNAEVTTAVTLSMNAAGIVPANYTTKIRNSADTADIDVAAQTAGTAILVKVQCTWGTVGLRPLGLIGASKLAIGMTTMRKEG